LLRAPSLPAVRTARRLRRLLHHWWLVRAFALHRVDVLVREEREAVLLEAFAGGVRLARLVAVRATWLPDEPWTEHLPRDHALPTYWVSECLVGAAFRHRGVGRRLLARLVEVAFLRHADALIVGWANSPQARQFSASLGFNVRGEAAYASLGTIATRLLA
jgi:GNAT superfamily N-acetyltransferase